MPDYSLSDIAAVAGNGPNGNNGNGFGNDGGWWILLLFILLGGFNGNRGYGGGAGGVGGNELYPWLNNAENINGGFRDQMIQTSLQGINTGVQNLATQLCNCCGDMQMALCNGFNATQNTINQGFNATNMGMMQGFNGVNMQTAQLASDIQLGNAQQTATILAEHCADRAALSDGVRDIIQSQTAGTQRILDQLCADKIDAKNEQIQALRQQLQMADLRASQIAQTAQIQAGQVAEVDALYNRLRDCPVPTQPVYGSQPIFTCQPNYSGCGCNQGCGCGIN